MNRVLAAACAAVLLTGSLTACSVRTADTASGATNNSGPADTTYSAPGSNRYASGADQDRGQYNAAVRNRQRYTGTEDGRYNAYSDGTVSQGHGAMARDSGSQNRSGNNTQNRSGGSTRNRGSGNAMDGGSNAMRDMGSGMGNTMRKIENGIDNAVRDITGQ